jgi:RimJ/RimL family protein N-acetyltransferase
LALRRSFATRVLDADEFAGFRCCPNPGEPWVQEAENYVRAFVLGHATWVLAFRDEQEELVAVSAFDPRIVEVPLAQPVAHEGWHLQVVAIAVEHQRQGVSRAVFDETFATMRDIAGHRVLVTANVHRDHVASRTAAERVGLLPLVPIDEHYWMLLGKVPPAEGDSGSGGRTD